MMEKEKVTTEWLGDMAFQSQIENFEISIDADSKFGGKDLGPKPKPLLLTALAGCTGMDITSLLKKMRVEISEFRIEVEGILTKEHPRHYADIHLKYIFIGNELNHAKIEKAVDLSQNRYCGVSYMLKKAANLTYEIEYVEEEELDFA